MTQERHKFEEWLAMFRQCHAGHLPTAYESWQASRETIKQELLSDEMVKRAVAAFEKRYDKNYSRDTNVDYMKAALQSVVEELCK